MAQNGSVAQMFYHPLLVFNFDVSVDVVLLNVSVCCVTNSILNLTKQHILIPEVDHDHDHFKKSNFMFPIFY